MLISKTLSYDTLLTMDQFYMPLTHLFHKFTQPYLPLHAAA